MEALKLQFTHRGREIRCAYWNVMLITLVGSAIVLGVDVVFAGVGSSQRVLVTLAFMPLILLA